MLAKSAQTKKPATREVTTKRGKKSLLGSFSSGGLASLRLIGKHLYSSSYESLMVKIVPTFICLCILVSSVAQTCRAAMAKPRVAMGHAAMNFRVAPLVGCAGSGFL